MRLVSHVNHVRTHAADRFRGHAHLSVCMCAMHARVPVFRCPLYYREYLAKKNKHHWGDKGGPAVVTGHITSLIRAHQQHVLINEHVLTNSQCKLDRGSFCLRSSSRDTSAFRSVLGM